MTGAQELSVPQEAASQPQSPPLSVVLLALAFGVVFVGGTTVGGYLLKNGPGTANRAVPPAPEGPTAVPLPSVPRPQAEPINDWRAQLTAMACEAECCGGLACAAKPVLCTSGLSCVPGTGSEHFAENEIWTLHLSAVQELDVEQKFVDPCKSHKDFWVCRSGTTACASQIDACANAGRSTSAIDVTGAELDQRGVTLDVRLGGPTGPVVATTGSIVNLRRGGLCRGFVVKASGGDVGRVSYFVLPP